MSFDPRDVAWWARRDPGAAQLPDGSYMPITFHPADELWLRGSSRGRSPEAGSLERPDGWAFRVRYARYRKPSGWYVELEPPIRHPVTSVGEPVRVAHGLLQVPYPSWRQAIEALKTWTPRRWSELPGGTPEQVRAMVEASMAVYGPQEPAYIRELVQHYYAENHGAGLYPPDFRLPRGLAKKRPSSIHAKASKKDRARVEAEVWRFGQAELLPPWHTHPGGPEVAAAMGAGKFDFPAHGRLEGREEPGA